jgi:hypothetical protein
VAALARTHGTQMHLKAFVAMGLKPLRLEIEGSATDAAGLGWKLAEQALA